MTATRLLSGSTDLLPTHELAHRTGTGSRLDALVHVSAELHGQHAARHVAEVVVRGAAETLGADGGAMWMISDDGRELVLQHSVGFAAADVERIGRLAVRNDADADRAAHSEVTERDRLFTAVIDAVGGGRAAFEELVAAVPLIVVGRARGVVALRFGRPGLVAQEDRDFLQLVAGHGAEAIERASLLRADRDARVAAEALAAREAFLSQLGLLASSLDVDRSLQAIVRHVVPFACDYVLLVGVAGEVLAVEHRDPAERALVEDVARHREPGGAIAGALQASGAQVVERVAAGAWSMLNDAQRARMARLAPTSYAVVPLRTRGATIGAMMMSMSSSNRHFAADDVPFLEGIASRAALALENARLFSDTNLLYGLTESVNRATSPEQVHRIAVDAIIAGLPADRAAIAVLDAAGASRFVAWTGLSDTYRAAVDGLSPWSKTEPRALVIDDVTLDPLTEPHLASLRAERIRSIAFIPIIHHGNLLGRFMVYSDLPQRFVARDVAIVTAVASHVGYAIERSRAQEREKKARMDAEDASRAREDILSVVSHDLRNPLSAILMASGSLARVEGDDPKAARIKTHAQRISRNVERMARLIDDLIDFSAVSSGRLPLKKADHAPTSILNAVLDIFQPLVDARGVKLEAAVGQELPQLTCDHDRIVQAISNHVSNALKVTEPGGSITVSAKLVDRDIVFAVADTGPGIKPDELAHVFDRYWRSASASYKGTGLGLSIAKGIVEAHGGQIWAKSAIPGVVVD